MNEQLKRLIDLQKLDSHILSVRMKMDEIPSKLSAEEFPLKNAEDAYEKAQHAHAVLEKKRKDKEREIDDVDEKVKKLRQRTSEIKTNKEYQAHLKEIEAVEKEVRSGEDELLAIMETVEEATKTLQEKNATVTRERQRIEKIKGELEREVAQCDQEMQTLQEERKRLADTIDGDVYNQYATLLKTSRGLAVVEARNEICQGCNIHMPPQLFVEIKTTEGIITCPQCRRILFYVRTDKEVQESAEDRQNAGA